MEIVVKVCANQGGLATALRNTSTISSEAVFRQFCQGFSQAKASFDFIDVGHGKERADSKIREDARWHLNNINCKMVVLGISHDSGYAPFLDELSSNQTTRQRLKILEGSPTVRELVATGVEVVNLNETVFRSDKLVTTGMAASSMPLANGASIGRSPTPLSDGGTTTTGSAASIDEAITRSTLYANAIVTASTSPPAPPPPKITFPSSTTKTLQTKAAAAAAAQAALLEKNKPAWNPGARGLDAPLTYNPVAVDLVKRRKGKDKFCNNYAITGYCTKDYCDYNHKLKPTLDEKKALSFLMRQSPCTYGQDCTLEDCIYGHNVRLASPCCSHVRVHVRLTVRQCPSVRDGQCMQPYCRFPPSLHPPNTKFKQPYLADD